MSPSNLKEAHNSVEHALRGLSQLYAETDLRPYPDRTAIERATKLLLDLLFPDLRVGSLQNSHEVVSHIEETGLEIFRLLSEQANIAEHHGIPTEAVVRLFENLLEIRLKLLQDLQAAYAGDPAARGTDEVVLSYPAYIAIATYRFAHELHGAGLPFIPRMMTEFAHRETGIDIHPGATIGEAFFIDHGTGVVIGETAEIGDNVRLYQGVTLGAYNFKKNEHGQLIRGQKRHPTIEDNVTIFANATILGGDTVVGARSIIGSNVWLTKSVDPDSVVTNEEPKLKIRSKNGDR